MTPCVAFDNCLDIGWAHSKSSAYVGHGCSKRIVPTDFDYNRVGVSGPWIILAKCFAWVFSSTATLLLFAINCVVQVSSLKEMGRIAAWRIVALVANEYFGLNSKVKCVCNSVCSSIGTGTHPEKAITKSVFGSSPKPAVVFVSDFNTRPKCFDSFCRQASDWFNLKSGQVSLPRRLISQVVGIEVEPLIPAQI